MDAVERRYSSMRAKGRSALRRASLLFSQSLKGVPQSTTGCLGEHTHGHGAGPHDGTLADWGGGKYHVEFTVDHEKQEATVYVLGSDEKSIAPIKTDKISLTIGDPELQGDLLPIPLEGDTDGLSSRFVGKHEKLGIVQEYAGTMSAEIEGTPYTGDFKEEAHDAHDHK